MCHDFKARFERIVTVDQREMCFAAVEERRKQRPEMPINRFERGAQAGAPFAVQAADGAAQPVHGFGQLSHFDGIAFASRFDFGEFAFGNEVDWAEPLALHCDTLELGRFSAGFTDRIGVERQFFGQQSCGTFEAFPRDAAHLNAAQLLIFGTRLRTRTGFARGGQGFANCHCCCLTFTQDGLRRPFGIYSALCRISETRGFNANHCCARLNLCGGVGDNRRFLVKRGRTLGHVFNPLARLAAPRPPIRALGKRCCMARLVRRRSLIARNQVCAQLRHPFARCRRRFVQRPRGSFIRCSGQNRERRQRRAMLFIGRGKFGFSARQPLAIFGRQCRRPFERHACLILGPQRVANFGIGSFAGAPCDIQRLPRFCQGRD